MNIFEIPRRTKRQKLIPVPDFDAKLPVTVVRGAKNGLSVLITAGVHNEEYMGIETANCISPAHRLACFVTEDFLKPAFCHIDLHCGSFNWC